MTLFHTHATDDYWGLSESAKGILEWHFRKCFTGRWIQSDQIFPALGARNMLCRLRPPRRDSPATFFQTAHGSTRAHLPTSEKSRADFSEHKTSVYSSCLIGYCKGHWDAFISRKESGRWRAHVRRPLLGAPGSIAAPAATGWLWCRRRS